MTNNRKINAWIAAARPRTLPLALASIAMGGFLGAYQGSFSWIIFFLTVVTTIGLQVLSNLANDYGDSVHGADHRQRVGPARMVQSGLISLRQMKSAMILIGVFTFVCGVGLLIYSIGFANPTFYIFLLLGLFSLGAAVNYTSGRRPYGYQGWGDISVLLFFGLVGVIGSNYLQTLSFRGLNLLPAFSCGLFAVAVLNINNIRDIESDRQAGKLSIPVRMGRPWAVKYHWLLLGTGLWCSLVYVGLDYGNIWQWLFLLVVPLLVVNGKAVSSKTGAQLDPYLKQMAITTLIYVFAFGMGLILSQ